MSNIIGKRIKELRQAKEWSGEYLAKTIGVSQSVISSYERGVKSPSRETLKKLANAFGVSMDAIAGDDSDKPLKLTILLGKGNNGYISTPIYKGLSIMYAGEPRGDSTKGHPSRWDTMPMWLFGVSNDFAEEFEPFIVEMQDDALEPSVSRGDLLCVNPNLPVNDGDLVFVELDGVKLARMIFWYRNGGGELQPMDTRYPGKQFSRYDIENGAMKVLGKVAYILAIPKFRR